MSGVVVEKDRILVNIGDMEDWEVEALCGEIRKMLSLHERHKAMKGVQE